MQSKVKWCVVNFTVVASVAVELQKTPEDDPQMR